jgi:hypothetical protein
MSLAQITSFPGSTIYTSTVIQFIHKQKRYRYLQELLCRFNLMLASIKL